MKSRRMLRVRITTMATAVAGSSTRVVKAKVTKTTVAVTTPSMSSQALAPVSARTLR
jgi:hypothetical protein